MWTAVSEVYKQTPRAITLPRAKYPNYTLERVIAYTNSEHGLLMARDHGVKESQRVKIHGLTQPIGTKILER